MRHVAVLKGQADVLENIAPCFVGDAARIKKLGDEWVLESSTFNSCGEPVEVFPIADDVLLLVHRILALYCCLYSPFSVEYIQSFDAEGVPRWRGIRGRLPVNVYSSKALSELAHPSGGQSLGSAIAQNAVSDPAVNEALQHCGDKEIGWSQIYDIIEFVGGANEIAGAEWANKNRTRHIRQTANHYRHLGSRKRYPLPAKPPTIDEARIFARDLLKYWMASRL